MKKTLSIISLSLAALNASAQNKGRFETYEFDNFKLHVYYTNDALGDASYIVEGRDALVTMEQPLFKDNVAEFDAYLARIGKPVEQRIADYHVGGTAHHDVVMPEGMPQFTKGEVYDGMMRNFARIFGDAMTAMTTGETSEVAFGQTATYAGVTFGFHKGASTDFPGANILIGGQGVLHPLAPRKSAHEPLADLVGSGRRRRDSREPKGTGIGSRALYRRARRSRKGRCRTVQDRLPEHGEKAIGREQDG